MDTDKSFKLNEKKSKNKSIAPNAHNQWFFHKSKITDTIQGLPDIIPKYHIDLDAIFYLYTTFWK